MQRRAHGETAGNVSEDVHTAKALQDLPGQVGDRLGLQQVRGKDGRIALGWQLGLGRGQGRLTPVHEGDMGPLTGEGMGSGTPQITGGAGDDGDFPCEALHLAGLPRRFRIGAGL
jgi:hypothetical protein